VQSDPTMDACSTMDAYSTMDACSKMDVKDYYLRIAQVHSACMLFGILELHEQGEVEISTCIWHKYNEMTAILR